MTNKHVISFKLQVIKDTKLIINEFFYYFTNLTNKDFKKYIYMYISP